MSVMIGSSKYQWMINIDVVLNKHTDWETYSSHAWYPIRKAIFVRTGKEDPTWGIEEAANVTDKLIKSLIFSSERNKKLTRIFLFLLPQPFPGISSLFPSHASQKLNLDHWGQLYFDKGWELTPLNKIDVDLRRSRRYRRNWTSVRQGCT